MLCFKLFVTWPLLCVLSRAADLPSILMSKCSTSSLTVPRLSGIDIETFEARPVLNFSIDVPQNGASPYLDSHYSDLNFCNVTVVYRYHEHGGRFSIRTTTWLPLKHWNGRFQGTGGSGFSAGLGGLGLAPAVFSGYSAAETDGGHSEVDPDPSGWAFDRPGHIDLDRLESFASKSLNDLANIGKAVTSDFYGRPPVYSYWNGCSTGGRQGLMLAQRYPQAFDGIAALSPAINWPSLTVSTYWPQQVMNILGHYPRQCELQYITKRAVDACDGYDGLEDGILSLPDLCTFNANETVGDLIECEGSERTISSETAAVANAAWQGNGFWYGLNHDALLAGMANTSCSGATDRTCIGEPFDIAPWISSFVEKNASFDLSMMTNELYVAAFRKSVAQYQYIIGTANPDLSAFHAAGGKMISTHGLADPVIFPNGTRQYYDSVLSLDGRASDYYRYFEAPGIGHCQSFGTQSFYPNDTMEALVNWVERGQPPEILTGVNETDRVGGNIRPLCLYPKKQRYIGGDHDEAKSFVCL